jgi:hypothetical protein
MNTLFKQKNQQNPFILPNVKSQLINPCIVIKNGLNKINKKGSIDIILASSLKQSIDTIEKILKIIIDSSYNNDNLIDNNFDTKLFDEFDKTTLISMITMIVSVIDKSQSEGTFDTLDESANLFYSLDIIYGLIFRICDDSK